MIQVIKKIYVKLQMSLEFHTLKIRVLMIVHKLLKLTNLLKDYKTLEI